MTCPGNPPAPAGYRVWRGAVPTPLTQWAMGIRDHINASPYGTTWTMPYGGQDVIARKDYHTWTYRNGQLVTGICIPGVTLYQPIPTTGDTTVHDLSTPDPLLAVYGADDVPREVNWWLVAGAGAAAAGVVGLFLLGMRAAGPRANPLSPERVDHHWKCGRHSGFPDCCIRYFIARWLPACDRAARAGRHPWDHPHGRTLHAFEHDHGPSGYVPCPSCLRRGRIVRVRPCKCGLVTVEGGELIPDPRRRRRRRLAA